MKIAVSFLKSKYDLDTTIELINNTDVEYLHVDIMDGNFVSNKTLTYDELKNSLIKCNKLLDVHLMVSDPIRDIINYKNLKPKFITIHSEINKDIDILINLIKSFNIGVGISIKPRTSIEKIEKYLDKVDNVLIMSVEPGKGGQKFDDSILYKIEVLDKLREENGYNYDISIDGGINKDTIDKVRGVDFVISGSFICMSDDYQTQVNNLR